MKRNLTLLAGALCLGLIIVGCSLPASRKAYNSLAAIGLSENSSVTAYYTLVVQGIVATNDVPAVTFKHLAFKGLFDKACNMAGSATNWTAAPEEVLQAASAVDLIIEIAKSKGTK